MKDEISANHLVIFFGGAGKLGKFVTEKFTEKYSDTTFLILDKYELIRENKNLIYRKCDAMDSEDIRRCLIKETAKFKKISILNMIGFDFPVSSAQKIRTNPLSVSDEELTSTINLNLLTCHKISSTLIDMKKSFHLIFMSSIYADKPTKSSLYENRKGIEVYKPYIYGASKKALEKLAQDLSTYLPKYKGRINTIALGGVNLDLPKEFIAKYSEWSPQNCMVSPLSFYKLLDWLIFEAPFELNGCTLKLDSGLSNT